MSVNNDGDFNDDHPDINRVIDNVRQEFKNILAKREELIKKLGKALENIGPKENICAEIKSALREQIANGLISRRDIERYCDDDWKKKTRPKKENDNLSFSRHEQQAIPLMIDIDGNSVTEQAAISSSDSSNNDAVNSEGSGNEEVKYVEEFNAGNELEDAIRISDNEVQQKSLSEQGRVKEIDSNIEGINTDLEIKSTKIICSRK